MIAILAAAAAALTTAESPPKPKFNCQPDLLCSDARARIRSELARDVLECRRSCEKEPSCKAFSVQTSSGDGGKGKKRCGLFRRGNEIPFLLPPTFPYLMIPFTVPNAAPTTWPPARPTTMGRAAATAATAAAGGAAPIARKPRKSEGANYRNDLRFR